MSRCEQHFETLTGVLLVCGDPILAEILSAAPDSSSRLAAGCVNGLGAALLGFCVAASGLSGRVCVAPFPRRSFGGTPFHRSAAMFSHPCWCGRPLDCLGHHRASCSLTCLGRRGCALESPAGPGVSRTGTKSFDECVLAGHGSGWHPSRIKNWYPRPGSRTPVFTVRN